MHRRAVSSPLARKVWGFSRLLAAEAERGTIQNASPGRTSEGLGRRREPAAPRGAPAVFSTSVVSNSALLLPDEVTKTEMFRGLGFLSDLIQDAFGLKEKGGKKKYITRERRGWSSS